jgi:hypothetical protein
MMTLQVYDRVDEMWADFGRYGYMTSVPFSLHRKPVENQMLNAVIVIVHVYSTQ